MGRACGKGMRHENFAPNPMNMADTNLDPAIGHPPQATRTNIAVHLREMEYGSRVTSGYG